MSEHSQANDTFEEQIKTDVAGILKKIQQQLVYLEKKIDTLLAQRPAQDRRPSRPYDNHRPYSGPRPEYGNRPAEGRSDRPARSGHFNKPHNESHSGFGYKKKPFFGKRER